MTVSKEKIPRFIEVFGKGAKFCCVEAVVCDKWDIYFLTWQKTWGTN